MVHISRATRRADQKAIILTDELGAGDAGRPPPPPSKHPCAHCGGSTWPMALLDSRKGSHFRLIRCVTCEKLDWKEER
jgi:hypothetical protein